MHDDPSNLDDEAKAISTAVALPAPSSTLPAPTFDWKEFDEDLAGSNLSEDQLREMLEALWYITVAFVDLGFGTTAVQQALLAGAANVVGSDKTASSNAEPSALASGFRAATTKGAAAKGVAAEAVASKRRTKLNPPKKRRRHADQ